MKGQPIIVFSDIHGDAPALLAVLKASRDFKAGLALFAGDWGDLDPGMEMMLQNRTCPLVQVRGNCDSPAQPLFQELCQNGWRILMYHGHRILEAQENFDLVITGHTHCSRLVKEGSAIYLNPGSASRPRDSQGPSFALVYEDEILVLRLTDCGIIKRCQR
ncbi:MAG: metallophosphoesterase family protein [Sphaerochaetaceae bacterium]|jgi:putative phosphoesterase|nr:metallophosphoesterase family protein [Sphaerochaetaceae bacterium]